MPDTSRTRQDNPSALPPGTRLGEFELLRLLGVGGFGIVYLAFDHALEREVAVKEYMPATLAGRTETMQVSLRSTSDAESFALGLRSFVNEAKLLARFDHPSLLKVHRFWEANGTAYMAMPVLRGRTLKDIRLEMAGPPDEDWVRRILMPLLGAIEKLHSEGVYHRDIAPDNIQIEPDGRPVLMDFGAARRVLSDKSQALTAILKPAYAPIEQYGEAGAVRQGPWTDLYSLGATLHHMLLGRPPAPATARTVHDEVSALTTAQLPGCSETFLQTVDWMLCPRPTDRPQSVAELRDVLEGRARPPQRRAVEPTPTHWERTSVVARPPGEGRSGVPADDAATQYVQPPAGAQAPATAAAATAAAAGPAAGAPPRRSPLVAGLALAAAAVVVAFWWWPQQSPPAPGVPLPASAPGAAVALAVPASAAVPSAPLAPPVASVASPEAPAKPAALKPTPTLKPAPPQPDSKPRAEAPAPEPGVAAPATQPVAAAPVTAPAPAPAPAPEPSVAAGPPPACGSREGIRYHVCMERECGRGEFAAHPACLRWKQEAKRD